MAKKSYKAKYEALLKKRRSTKKPKRKTTKKTKKPRQRRAHSTAKYTKAKFMNQRKNLASQFGILGSKQAGFNRYNNSLSAYNEGGAMKIAPKIDKLAASLAAYEARKKAREAPLLGGYGGVSAAGMV